MPRHSAILLMVFLSNVPLMVRAVTLSETKQQTKTWEINMEPDTHSFARPEEAVVEHLDLNISVDFDKKQITGKASLKIENKKAVRQLYLDTNDLNIDRVTLGENETKTGFTLGRAVEYLGQPLVIDILPDTKLVHLYYSTRPSAAALQWLDPAQTAGGKKPYLYTQSQAILARTWVPCQDTPRVRMTYHARVKVPAGLMAVMSAENPISRNPNGVYEFNMPQPIPSYLLAMAVGDIEFRATGARTGVYSEPAMVEKAAWEFAETEKMVEAAEKLYGPYRWGRYDIIVLPPSFPWGGMENPRLTFATPTVVAGDRSLVSLVAHELAHSWSGNLVTSATWNDFWLNEGFTTYFEHRIMEQVYGREHDDMLSVLSYQDWKKEVAQLGTQSPDTHLKLNMDSRDPEDTATQIPYEKGQFFLRMIEEAVGRPRWDAFLKNYFHQFSFQSLNTEDFLRYLRSELLHGDPALEKKLQIDTWVYQPGIPSNVPSVHSTALDRVDAQTKGWIEGKPARDLRTAKWSTQEWIHFLRNLPPTVTERQLGELDSTFHFSNSHNAEILYEWLLVVIARNYKSAYPAIERFLSSNGRRKYVKSLFTELAKRPEDLEFAKQIYKKTRPTYHAISVSVADKILHWKAA